jgi:hypothetical protein
MYFMFQSCRCRGLLGLQNAQASKIWINRWSEGKGVRTSTFSGPACVPCMGLSHVSSIRPVGLTTLCMGSEPVNKGIEYQNPKLLPYLLLLLPPVRRRRLRQPHYPAGSSRCCSPASPACRRSTQGRHRLPCREGHAYGLGQAPLPGGWQAASPSLVLDSQRLVIFVFLF